MSQREYRKAVRSGEDIDWCCKCCMHMVTVLSQATKSQKAMSKHIDEASDSVDSETGWLSAIAS